MRMRDANEPLVRVRALTYPERFPDPDEDGEDGGDGDGIDEPVYGQSQQVFIDDDGDDDILADEHKRPPFSWKKLWAFTGPGWLMSIAYLDPGNIESDLQTGAQTGYQLLWVLWWATVMGLVLQLLAARLGVVTGRHLAEVCRTDYPKPARYTLWIMTELALIGSDIQEVVGSAIALNVLSDGAIQLWMGVLITATDCFSFLFLEGFGIRKLEAFFALLLSMMVVAFGRLYVVIEPDQALVTRGVIVPALDPTTVHIAVGMIGAVIMPHNIYLHSALVQSRHIDRSKAGRLKEANFYNTIESTVALFCSFLVNMFVVGVFAHLFRAGRAENHPDVDPSCFGSGIGLLNTAACLTAVRPERGAIKYIWGLGLLAAGQSSTMTGTYAGQFVMQGFLELKIKAWQRVLLTRTLAMGPTLAVAVTVNHHNLDTLNEWLNILQSVQLPFALIPIIYFNAQADVMGDFAIGKRMLALYTAMALSVVAINVYLVVATIPQHTGYIVIAELIGMAYLAFIGYLCIGPKVWSKYWAKFMSRGSDPSTAASAAIRNLSAPLIR